MDFSLFVVSRKGEEEEEEDGECESKEGIPALHILLCGRSIEYAL